MKVKRFVTISYKIDSCVDCPNSGWYPKVYSQLRCKLTHKPARITLIPPWCPLLLEKTDA